jgi:hypothetical protein
MYFEIIGEIEDIASGRRIRDIMLSPPSRMLPMKRREVWWVNFLWISNEEKSDG